MPVARHHRDRRPEANVSSSIKSLPVLIVISVGTAILVAAIFLLAILGLAKDISNKPEQLADPIVAAAGGLVCLIGICFAVYLNNKKGRKAKERPQNAANSCFIFVHALCRRMQNRYGVNTLGLYCLLSAYIETNFNTSSNMCWNKCYDGRTDLFIFTWNIYWLKNEWLTKTKMCWLMKLPWSRDVCNMALYMLSQYICNTYLSQAVAWYAY